MSTATVSRTMSGRGPVREATQRRVLQAAARLHYLPSAAAQSLRTERTMIIGVLVPDLGNPIFLPFLRGVQHAAQSRGYSVLVVDGQRSTMVEEAALERLRAHGVDALVLAGPARASGPVEKLRNAGIIVMDPDREGRSGRSLIGDLEQPGTLAMCEALAELRHRRIAYVSRGAVLGKAGLRRWRELRQRCEVLGVEAERVTIARDGDALAAAGLLSGVLRRADPVSAVVCSTHGLAPDVLRGLRAAGIDFPRDCSFVTYGDSAWAEAYRPAVSVVTFDLYEVGVATTIAGIRLLTGDATLPVAKPALPARFVRRESVGPAPQ